MTPHPTLGHPTHGHPTIGQRTLSAPTPSRRALLRGALSVAAATLTAPLLTACGEDEPAPGAATAPTGGSTPTGAAPRTIRTAVYAKNHASSPLYWERFAPEGVTVEVAIVTSASDVQLALEAGNMDFGLMGVYNTLIAASEGTITSRIVSMLSRQGIGLIGRTDRQVTTVASLAGKKVAVPPPGVQVLALNSLLAEAGLVLGEDVEGIPLAFADHVTALERGDVDAFIGTEPLCTQSVVSGVGTRIGDVYTTPIGDINTALWASPAMLEDPDACRLAVSLQKQAAEYLTPAGKNDPDVWRDLLVTQFGYREEVYAEVLSNLGAEWRFDDTRAGQFMGAGALLVEQGVIAAEPDYEALFAREYWEA